MRQGLDSGLFQRITDAAQIDAVLDALMATDWVVYSKPCSTHTVAGPITLSVTAGRAAGISVGSGADSSPFGLAVSSAPPAAQTARGTDLPG